MLKVEKHGILLKPTNLEFENQGVFNPACVKQGNNVHMFYRAFSKENRSTIGYCKLEGPLKVVERRKTPLLTPDLKWEHNLEDPRISLIGKTYHMMYTAYDGTNVRMAHATSKDLKTFEKHGSISPEITYDEAEDLFRERKNKLKERYFLFESYFKDIVGKDVLLWDKDAMLFPKKIKGKYALLHRVLPDIQIAYFKDFKDLTLDFWKDYYKNLSDHVVLESKHWFETRNIGGGCPPIETDKGWLLIYHAVDDMNRGKIYRAGAALLDKRNPQKVLGHLEHPLISPTEKWELKGDVDRVVFPSGHALFGNKLYIYYGGADKKIGVASVNINHLLKELLKNKSII
jgi:beta-1,2-mannobiose phosphorylase / 1,2-beta-oligomannan phosphorylase